MSKEVSLQVRSVPKNLMTLVMRGSIGYLIKVQDGYTSKGLENKILQWYDISEENLLKISIAKRKEIR